MTPATQKMLMRFFGLALTSFGAALVLTEPAVPGAVLYRAIGALLGTIGGALTGQANTAPGDVNPNNVNGILQGARKALGTDVVLKITSIHPPPPASGR